MVDHNFHHRTGPYKAIDIAERAGAELHGIDGDTLIHDVAPLQTAQKDCLTFLDNRRYISYLEKTKATACFIHPDLVSKAPEGLGLFVTEKPYKAYALAAQKFYPKSTRAQDKSIIAPSAAIAKSAKIGKSCVIEAGVFIGENVSIGAGTKIGSNSVISDAVQIGEDCIIHANCTISHSIIGDAVTIFPGVCIGQAGFGYAMEPTGHISVPQLGRVIIGDHVEIGANTTIDRGSGPDTEIGSGTIIDNLVQIGHNVHIGKGCVLVSQTGISGSTVLEDYVVTAGQVGIAGHLRIGMGAQLGAKSGIMHDIPAGARYLGYPAVPVREFMRQTVCLQKMATKKKKQQ